MQYTFTDLRHMPELRGLTPQDLHSWRRGGVIDTEKGTDRRFIYSEEDVKRIKAIWRYLRSGCRLQDAYRCAAKELGLPLYPCQTDTGEPKYSDANTRVRNYRTWLSQLTERERGETFFNGYLVDIAQGRFNGLNYLIMTFYNVRNLTDAVAALRAIPELKTGKPYFSVQTRGEEGNKLRSQILDALEEVDEINTPRTFVRAIQERPHPNLMVDRVIHGNHRFGWKKHKSWDREERNERLMNLLHPRNLNIK